MISAVPLSGCTVGPKGEPGDTGQTSTGEASADPPATTTASSTDPGTATSAPTTGTEVPDTATTGPAATATSSEPGDSTTSLPPDMGTQLCDLAAQDCPAGEKCNPAGANPFGDPPVCVPVVPDPRQPGEACSVLGDPADGTDDCALGSACLFPDDGGEGKCLSFCAYEDLQCAPGQQCFGQTCQVCLFGFCDTPCDPRQIDACKSSDICVSADQSWVCTADLSGDGGQAGDPCEFLNACDPGLHCTNAGQVVGCAGDNACCSPLCSTDAPNTCPGAAGGEVCVPWYDEGEAPPELTTLGVCSVPL